MKALLLTLLFCGLNAIAQDQAPTGGLPSGARAGTATRGVMRYGALEKSLLEAEQKKDQNALHGLVADDFEVRSAEKNGPTPRELWQSQALGDNITWFQIRNVAVHEFAGVAVVSFLLDRRGESGNKAVPATVFVVDVWRQGEGKLAVRYVSTPGHPTAAQLMPTGKE